MNILYRFGGKIVASFLFPPFHSKRTPPKVYLTAYEALQKYSIFGKIIALFIKSKRNLQEFYKLAKKIKNIGKVELGLLVF